MVASGRDVAVCKQRTLRQRWSFSVCGSRAGFTLFTFFSHRHRPRVSCQFCWKTGDLFCSSLLFTRGSPIISVFPACKKFAVSFVGAPVRPNMLNMPKSAAVQILIIQMWMTKFYVIFLVQRFIIYRGEASARLIVSPMLMWSQTKLRGWTWIWTPVLAYAHCHTVLSHLYDSPKKKYGKISTLVKSCVSVC